MEKASGLQIGLTGGIASGKSTVARRLVELGAVLIDADALAREAVAPGSEGLAAVVEAFGPGVLGPDGAMDRAAVGRLVFGDEDARDRLNGIVHPRVRAAATALRAAAVERTGERTVVVQDIPLLVETGQAGAFDVVVTVAAPLAERIRRMVEDRGMLPEEAAARIGAQATDDERAAAADVVLDNAGTRADLLAQVDDFWARWVAPSLPGTGAPEASMGDGP
ncbi:dephospho-CoA kinase [Zhihengliuella sp.]|uniref:dephospho-CoA kinase n=1 Tax=Zhihengliuella sp. TaxID=1954483 RepID=UPI0028114288|nr:dephospho-CoA kinase [Zhihengliuella sp.]